jgi:16S rRNA (cytosine1402-N4)-methyltransferase
VAHEPVLVDRVVEFIVPSLERGGTYVDATVGQAGHARAVLDAAPKARLVGIDRDPDALEASGAHLAPFADRVRLVRDNFAKLETILERLGIASIRGILLDVGVASSQLDEASRGFSFRLDGPLDMRMDPGAPLSADDVVNRYPRADLERVLRIYGEERFAGRIARAIERARPIEGTVALAEVVKDAIPAATRRTGGHPARRTFQAIRIEVNGEIHALEAVLPPAVDALEQGGRLVAISYHSLEDRAVKRFLAAEVGRCTCPPDFPVCRCGARARLRVLTPRPVRPTTVEIERNPRARAARLRAAERLGEENAHSEMRRSA